ncbi:MAG: intradiol ring-cleavage dioxygenase [Micromonosporaceae bacterium]
MTTDSAQAATPEELAAEVLRAYLGTPDARLREILQSLVRHLHAFVTETSLTSHEWMEGIRFLTETGQKCDDQRQEFILLSDTLGVSSLVDLLAHLANRAPGATESTVLGPFYVPGAPHRKPGENIGRPQDGEPTLVRGRVTDTDGRPLAGAQLDIWQTAANGFYDVQDPEQPPFNLRGIFTAGPDGRYELRTVRPVSYPVPTDGPVGRLLRASGRHAWRAAHIHAIVSAEGHEPVTTHIFDAANEYLESDTVFGVKDSLIKPFLSPSPGDPADVAYVVEMDFALAPATGHGATS